MPKSRRSAEIEWSSPHAGALLEIARRYGADLVVAIKNVSRTGKHPDLETVDDKCRQRVSRLVNRIAAEVLAEVMEAAKAEYYPVYDNNENVVSAEVIVSFDAFRDYLSDRELSRLPKATRRRLSEGVRIDVAEGAVSTDAAHDTKDIIRALEAKVAQMKARLLQHEP